MRTAIIAFAFLLTACGGDSPTEILTAIGAWDLASVNGKPLPVLLLAGSGGNCPVTIRSARYDLKEGGTFTASQEIGTESGGQMFCTGTSFESGTYTVQGNTIRLKGRTLTLSSEGLSETQHGSAFVYHK